MCTRFVEPLREQLRASLMFLRNCSNDSLVIGREMSWHLRFQLILDGLPIPAVLQGSCRRLRFLVMQDNPLLRQLLSWQLLGLGLNQLQVNRVRGGAGRGGSDSELGPVTCGRKAGRTLPFPDWA